MSVDTSHLLDIEAEPPFIPEPKPPLDEARFLAGEGLGVVYSGGDVMYFLTEEVTRKMQAIEQAVSSSRLPFGYAVTVETSADNPGIGTVTIAEGLLYDMSFTTGQGWFVREHEIPEGMLGNVEFPCLIYGRVPLSSFTSTQDGLFSGGATIEGRGYIISVQTATTVQQLSATALTRLTEKSIFRSNESAPTPTSSYFQFRIADIDDEGTVTTQYAIGSVTLPNTATPVIRSFSIT